MKQGTHNLGGDAFGRVALARVDATGVTISSSAGGKRTDLTLSLEQAAALAEVIR